MKKILLLCVVCIAFPFSLFALETKEFNDWEYVCTDGKKDCFLSHIVTDKSGEKLIMQLIIGKVKESKNPILAFQLPPILTVGQEINVALDNNTFMTLDVKSCNESNCQVFGMLTPEFMKEFKAAGGGIVQFQTNPENLMKIYFSLDGFTKAVDFFVKS